MPTLYWNTMAPHSRRLAGLGVPLVLAALYVFSFQFVGFLDLPNHLARAYVMLHCLRDTGHVACSHYAFTFVPVPFLFADLSLMLWLELFPPLLAERVATFVLLALMIVGWYLLYCRIHGRLDVGYIAGLALMLSNYLYNGFYAYLLSIGLALFWIYFWWNRRDRKDWRTQGVLALGMALLFGFHLAGFLFVFLIYVLYDFHKYMVASGSHLRVWIKSLARSAPVIATFLALYAYQQTVAGSTATGTIYYKPLPRKLATVLYPFLNFSVLLDSVLVLLLFFILGLACLPGFQQLRQNFWAFMSGILFLLFFLAPSEAHGAYDFDVRFLLMAYFALFLALGSAAKSRAVYSLSMVTVLMVGFGMHLYYKALLQREIAPIYEIIESVPKGGRLLGVNSIASYPEDTRSRVNPFAHLKSYYQVVGGSLTDGLFDCSFNQNLAYFCYRDTAVAVGSPLNYEFLDVSSLRRDDMEHVKVDFDYILLTGGRSHGQLEAAILGATGFRVLRRFDGATLLENPRRRGASAG